MKRLCRSRTDTKIAGICGGIGETYEVDPTLIRLALVFAAIITGELPLLATYIVGWVIIPLAPETKQGA
jgi:phage shock protein C